MLPEGDGERDREAAEPQQRRARSVEHKLNDSSSPIYNFVRIPNETKLLHKIKKSSWFMKQTCSQSVINGINILPIK